MSVIIVFSVVVVSFYLIAARNCDDNLCSASLLSVHLHHAVVGRYVIEIEHYNRLHRQSAFAANASHVCQCSRYHLRPLLVNCPARRHFFPEARLFYAPTHQRDALRARYPIAMWPNAKILILNCFSVRMQSNQSLHLIRLYFVSMILFVYLPPLSRSARPSRVSCRFFKLNSNWIQFFVYALDFLVVFSVSEFFVIQVSSTSISISDFSFAPIDFTYARTHTLSLQFTY